MTRRARAIAAENRRLAVLLGAALLAFGALGSLGGCRRPAAPAAAPEDLEHPEGPPVCTGPACLPPVPR